MAIKCFCFNFLHSSFCVLIWYKSYQIFYLRFEVKDFTYLLSILDCERFSSISNWLFDTILYQVFYLKGSFFLESYWAYYIERVFLIVFLLLLFSFFWLAVWYNSLASLLSENWGKGSFFLESYWTYYIFYASGGHQHNLLYFRWWQGSWDVHKWCINNNRNTRNYQTERLIIPGAPFIIGIHVMFKGRILAIYISTSLYFEKLSNSFVVIFLSNGMNMSKREHMYLVVFY